jgi:tRNA (cmo5U34)-methyltransferase
MWRKPLLNVRKMTKHKSDSLYASPLTEMVDFQFDERVVDVFPDMIQRSVPGYGTLINMIGILATQAIQPNTRCYDLGCSLGAVSLSIQQRVTVPCEIIGVDNSEAMIKRCTEVLAQEPSAAVVELVCNDIQNIIIKNASVVVLNFTLQFIPVAERVALLQAIYAGLNPGGILVLSEKIAFEEPTQQDFYTELHHDFKRANGYTDLEVSQKRSALDNVLIPETRATHQQRLANAGFASSDIWFQCANFASFVAVK